MTRKKDCILLVAVLSIDMPEEGQMEIYKRAYLESRDDPYLFWVTAAYVDLSIRTPECTQEKVDSVL